MKFQVYEDAGGEWRWRFVASNGRTVADSGEGYTRKSNCIRAVGAVSRGVEDASTSAIEVLEKDGSIRADVFLDEVAHRICLRS